MRDLKVGCGADWSKRLSSLGLPVLQQEMRFAAFAHRQDVDTVRALTLLETAENMDRRDEASLKALIHYEGYLKKQDMEVARFRQIESQHIPESFDYQAVQGLSTECRQRLQDLLPRNLGQASRISGITPTAIACLLIHLRQRS